MVKDMVQSHGGCFGHHHRSWLLFTLSSECLVPTQSPHGSPYFDSWSWIKQTLQEGPAHGTRGSSWPGHRHQQVGAWNRSCYQARLPCLNSSWLINHGLQSAIFCPSVPSWKARVLSRIQFLKQSCLGWCHFPPFLKEKEVSPLCPSLLSAHSAVRGGQEHHFRADGHLEGGSCSVELQREDKLVCHTLWFRNLAHL